MVSQEFKATVSGENLLRTRIMLKDSLVVDPTFAQFEEMLSYAGTHLPKLFVPFDGGYLENDEAMWNGDVMNEELVQLVTNFSEVRINHLKRVVSVVLRAEAEKVRRKRAEQQAYPASSSRFDSSTVSRSVPLATKVEARRRALGILQSECGKIQHVMDEVSLQHTWKPSNVEDVERAARVIIQMAQDYKKNR